jgi:hypothetical protein
MLGGYSLLIVVSGEYGPTPEPTVGVLHASVVTDMDELAILARIRELVDPSSSLCMGYAGNPSRIKDDLPRLVLLPRARLAGVILLTIIRSAQFWGYCYVPDRTVTHVIHNLRLKNDRMN